jgi:aminopeptidase-like protein
MYTCTFNATTSPAVGANCCPLGGEHKGYTIFGTVIDTTPAANRARVGNFQNQFVATDQLKFVWPNILTTGHTYEIALFEDHQKNRTCAGTPNGTEPQWLFPVPAVTGDFTFNFMHNARAASCQDFPTGPIP